MIIQKLLFPGRELAKKALTENAREKKVQEGKTPAESEDISGLFFHGGVCDYENRILTVPEGGDVLLDTCYNSFSAGIWKKYTGISDLSLCLEVSGEDVTASAYQADKSQTRPVPCTVSKEDGKIRILFKEIPDEGILYAAVHFEKNGSITGGAFEAECVQPGGGKAQHDGAVHAAEHDKAECGARDVRISLGICTFRRESFVSENLLRLLKSGLLDDGRLEVFISDNAGTLKNWLEEKGGEAARAAADAAVHIFPNKNAGGAGGFTRTMIEAVFRSKGRPFTHMLLTDDDAIVLPEVIERTILFLSCVEEEYDEAILCGAMFSMEKKHLQLEAGDAYRGLSQTVFNADLDMRDVQNVVRCSYENPVQYGPWIYNCIPTRLIRQDNLPCPLFIHFDDIEYGLRHKEKGVIVLTGINVWHPDPRGKYTDWIVYYDTRNAAIAMATQKAGLAFDVYKSYVRNLIISALIHYNYRRADAVLDGVRAFMAGPDPFMETDPVELHDKIRWAKEMLPASTAAGAGGAAEPVSLPPSFSSLKEYALEVLSLMFFPLKKLTVVKEGQRWEPFTAKSVFVLTGDGSKGYTLTRSYKEMFRVIRELRALMKALGGDYDNVVARWKEKKKDYTSLSFWEKYLEI